MANTNYTHGTVEIMENKNVEGWSDKEKLARFKHYKKFALQAAKDFGYGDHIIARIKTAESEGEVDRAMKQGRKEKFG